MGRRRKRKQKPVVVYPPVPTRKWIPPDQRKKRPKKKPPPYPPQMNTKLELSTLKKVWHIYNVIHGCAVLLGHYSQYHRRFSYISNGYQGAANCVMAILFSKLTDCSYWNPFVLDNILNYGDRFYLECRKVHKSKEHLKITDLSRELYIFNHKIFIDFKGCKFKGLLYKDLDNNSHDFLTNVITDFFKKHDAGVISTEGCAGKHFAIWRTGGGYFLFDPTDHDTMCWPWKDLTGKGYCFLVRFPTTDKLVEVVHRNLPILNIEFVINPVGIERVVSINTRYPDCMVDANLEGVDEKLSKLNEDEHHVIQKQPDEVIEEEIEEVVPDSDNDSEKESPENVPKMVGVDLGAGEGFNYKRPVKGKRKVLVEKPKVESVTFFNYIIPDRIGILLAETHQDDPAFASCPGPEGRGKSCISNAVAALVTLRDTKAKYWTTRLLTNVLRLGYRICKESRRALTPEQFPGLKNIIKRIELNENVYTPVVTDLGAVGQLQSPDQIVLDLLPALKELLSECDTIVVQGPLSVAVWKEEGLYYMFDPNERDPNGFAIVKEIKVGSVMETVDYIAGVACLTWFKDLRDLVEMYMRNVEKCRRREQFVLSNVEIKDYQQLPENWRNFSAIANDRWILRGHFSQSDRKFERTIRNTQCTANCAMAIAYAHIVPITDWTRETLDTILLNGNDYYTDCVRYLQKNEKFVQNMLMVIELDTEFIVEGKVVIMDITECLVNGYITYHDDYKNTLNLKKGLTEFLVEYDFGIVTCRGISVAVLKKGGSYFYFDSHDRDHEGFAKPHGKCCVQRFTCIYKMAEVIMANLGPAGVFSSAIYNISRIEMSIYNPPPPDAPLDEDDDDEAEGCEGEEEDEGEEGIEISLVERFKIELPAYNFTKLTKRRAILRSRFHQADDSFGTNAGKQTIPNLLTVIGMSRVFDPRKWDEDRLNDVLLRGNELYKECMDVYYKGQATRNLQEEEDQDEGDYITLENVVKEYKIGVNKFTIEFEQLGEGIIGPEGVELGTTIGEHLKQKPVDDNDFNELIIQIDDLELVIWKFFGLYFLFDPKARDERGDTYGKEEWSEISSEPEEIEEEEQGEYDQFGGEEGGPEIVDNIKRFLENEWKQFGEQEEEEEEFVKPKHLQEYWDEMTKKLGKSCLMWFVKARHLIKHVVENTRPRMREETNYKLTKVRLVNEPEVKDTYDPELGPKEDGDLISGDWYEFKEIDHGQWILRGSIHQKNIMFPETNRGKQSDANCLIALAYGALYGLSKYGKHTIDQILKYGDRLYSATKRLRRKQLEEIEEIMLFPEDIDEILKLDCYTIENLLKSFCIGDDSMSAEVKEDFLTGEVHAQDVENEMDVLQALEAFYADKSNQYCLLSAKGVTVGIWRVRAFYYMFDPCERGPHGLKFENGVACITRFVELKHIVDLFLKNIPRIGKNFFTIHKVIPILGSCNKPMKVETRRVDDPLKITGFVPFARGKHIIRGTIHQDHVMFGKGTNAQCAPIAMVTLAMTLIHNTEYWTKLIIDDVITIGDRIYGTLLERCDFEFNPWEEKLTVAMSPTNFKIGKIKVDCEMRYTEQSGIIDTKDPNVLNLRQGIERFFEENSYGIVQTDLLTVPIWEAEDEENSNYLYMLDPNCRGPTGQPVQEDGTACLLKFCGAKLLADHIVSLVFTDREGGFLITPVEIVIERDGKRKKTKRYGVLKKPEPTEESPRSQKIGRLCFYTVPNADFAILRGSKSQNCKKYSENSRGNQDVPNCIVSYVMDKLIPLTRWNYKTIDMLLDIGDQLYKDSYMIYDPRDRKLRMETLIRDVVIRDVRVKISVGAPIIAAQFNMRLLTEALYNTFNLKPFCIVLADQNAVSIFKKEEEYYLFDPMDLNLQGNQTDKGSAAILRFNCMPALIIQMMKILQADGTKETFHIIIVGIKEIERIPVGTNFNENPPHLLKPDFNKCTCDKTLFGELRRKKKPANPNGVQE